MYFQLSPGNTKDEFNFRRFIFPFRKDDGLAATICFIIGSCDDLGPVYNRFKILLSVSLDLTGPYTESARDGLDSTKLTHVNTESAAIFVQVTLWECSGIVVLAPP